ncbi:MAG: endonuclease/exonuclease/phosphatase family protein [bacterium]|nr:endonuclease/exonuclease/phosphatase family protein [bacterium]
MTKLKLISLNIEMDKHLPQVLPFLEREQPDVVCLQEVFEKDMELFQNTLGMRGDFVSVSIVDLKYVEGVLVHDEELAKKGPQGIAVFTKLPVHSEGVRYYHGEPGEVPRHSRDYHRFLLWREVEKDGAHFTLGTTHFTWTPDGSASPEQHKDIQALFTILEEFPEVAFCGDFNAPRGGEIWGLMAKRYTDTIPLLYDSSIDPEFHRAKGLRRLVDGLFCTSGYRASEVRLVEGVSDHKAIVGFLEKLV